MLYLIAGAILGFLAMVLFIFIALCNPEIKERPSGVTEVRENGFYIYLAAISWFACMVSLIAIGIKIFE